MCVYENQINRTFGISGSGDSMLKNLLAMQETQGLGFDPWFGKSPGGGHGNPL